FSYGAAAPPIDREELLRTREAMTSRGPDAAGTWLSADGRAGLASRRLAILDLSPTGAQPMAGEGGRVQLVINGEIYNSRQLRAELEAAGCRFRGSGDTEVVLALSLRHGEAMLPRLARMFALAAWGERPGPAAARAAGARGDGHQAALLLSGVDGVDGVIGHGRRRRAALRLAGQGARGRGRDLAHGRSGGAGRVPPLGVGARALDHPPRRPRPASRALPRRRGWARRRTLSLRHTRRRASGGARRAAARGSHRPAPRAAHTGGGHRGVGRGASRLRRAGGHLPLGRAGLGPDRRSRMPPPARATGDLHARLRRPGR